ncbi:HGGxSTG domain-containing protein [Desulfosarcina sp.]|uniref:HGGxSTG domain-containing protein n=1 Tax=Desulfosarcina sp. TaxID=2027861 RepID=UPI0039B9694B
MRNGRCKLHGGMSTGPKRDVTGRNKPNYRTGLHARDKLNLACLAQRLVRDSRELLQDIG